MTIGTYISIINLNVNRLNAPTKRHRLNYKKNTHIYAEEHTHTHTHTYIYI